MKTKIKFPKFSVHVRMPDVGWQVVAVFHFKTNATFEAHQWAKNTKLPVSVHEVIGDQIWANRLTLNE